MSDTEFDLIERCFKGQGGASTSFTQLGIGDDASIHQPRAGMELVISTDTSVQGIHWPDDLPLAKAADRAVCSALSDLAAMGAEAVAVWVNIMSQEQASIEDMAEGVGAALKRYDVELAGGDTSRASFNAVAVTVAGELPKGTSMRRDLAKADDNIWLVGKVGLHALGLQQWLAAQHAGEYVHYLEIKPLLAEGVKLREMGVCCCIDVSDGLLQDAGHIAAASGIAMDIEVTKLPEWLSMCDAIGEKEFLDAALCGGEDYALLFTSPASMEFSKGLATKIGQCRPGEGVSIYREGLRCDVKSQGFLHFG